MPTFSKKSEMILSTCHEDLQTLFNEVIKEIDCSVICGFRDKEEQDAAFNSNKSKLAWPNSKHNYVPSLAVDVAFYPIDWSNTKQFYYFGGYVMSLANSLNKSLAIKYHVRWGGNWKRDHDVTQQFNDLVHFELV